MRSVREDPIGCAILSTSPEYRSGIILDSHYHSLVT
jgi:hypothetical protein